jgi:RNA polymerase sigma-70 factor (ECF subfamily)
MQVTILTVIMAGLLTVPAAAGPPATVKDAPPVVIKTEPRAGDTDVDAAKVTEIRVTFSKDMADGSWSWSRISKETFPTTTGKPRYDADKRTCVLPVKLEPGKAYVIWLNPEKFQSFRDADGHPAVFYPLVFETKK